MARSAVFSFTCSQAALTAGPTEAADCDPPETGALGRPESPSFTSISDRSMTSDCAATCCMTVYIPVPISCVPEPTKARPLGKKRATQLAAERLAG